MLHSLLHIGSFSFLMVHGNFKTSAEKSNWKLMELWKGVFSFAACIIHLFEREDYKKITRSAKYLLNICATRED